MRNKDIYLKAIHQGYPDLKIHTTVFNQIGQNSDVLVVNEAYIFRFPKYPHVRDELAAEAAILQFVQAHVPLAIPAPEFLKLDAPVGAAFTGYQMIPGEPLWGETYRAAGAPVQKRLAAQAAGFLKALHSTVVPDDLRGRLPLHDTYEEVADIYARIESRLFSLMRPDARSWTANHFEGYLNRWDQTAYSPVLKHGDFGPSNILYDPERQALTGIIDFGGAGLGDPAYDFAGLLSGYGEGFLQACTAAYPALSGFMDRVQFYQGTFALLEALFGIENGDDEALEAGLVGYR